MAEKEMHDELVNKDLVWSGISKQLPLLLVLENHILRSNDCITIFTTNDCRLKTALQSGWRQRGQVAQNGVP